MPAEEFYVGIEAAEIGINNQLNQNDMYSDQQIENWHQEYLQGMKKILTDAANEIPLERIKEDIFLRRRMIGP